MNQRAHEPTPTHKPASSHAIGQRPRSRGPFKLVGIDLDGTLLRPDGTMSRRCVDAIRDAADRGVSIVLIAHNSPPTLTRLSQQLRLASPQICFNGAVVYDPVNRVAIFHNSIPSMVADRIVRLSRAIDPKLNIKVDAVDERYTDDLGTNPGLTTSTPEMHMSGDLGQLGKVISKPVTKISMTSAPAAITRIKQQLTRMLNGQLTFLSGGAHDLQIVAAGVTKGNALKQVGEHLGITASNTMAIGDGLSDLDMIQSVGLGIAMGNAQRELKEAAHRVAPSNNDDGVAVVLAKYVLI